jgi:Tfp pilus assembly protein PilZ
MKKRPLSIRILAALFLLSPLGVLAELMYLYRIPFAYWTKVFYHELWTWQIFAFVIVTPLVGLCVWTVHRWAYPVLLAFSGLILVNNLAVWLSGLGMTSVIERALLMIGLFALVLVEVRKEFKAPYFNPRLRWWEQAHRYATDRVRVIVRAFDSQAELFEAHSFDVSATGLYAVTEREVKIGDRLKLDVILPGGRQHTLSGEVVWIHGGSDRNPQGFGCRFAKLDRGFRRELREAVAELHAGMKDR